MNANIPKTIKKLFPFINPTYASGSWVYQNKTKYLDFTSGIGALSTGHNHPLVVDSVKNQLNKYVHTPQQVFGNHSILNRMIDNLLPIMPDQSLDTLFFVNSGSEATDNSIKLARNYTNKNGIIALKKGFHGRTLGALSITSSNLQCKSNMGISNNGVFFCDNQDISSLENIINNYISPLEVAAIIIESVQGEGGINSIDSKFLKQIKTICEENNILFIADEVQCGMGRTGTMWNIEQKGIIPDIMTFGKGIGSGFPIAGVVANNLIMNNSSLGFLGGTYGGNAICCAAVNATLEIFNRENLLENTIEMGYYFRSKLIEIPYIKSINQYGLMISIELIDEYEPSIVVQQLAKRGVLVLLCGTNNEKLRILPPLNVSKNEIDHFCNKLLMVL